MAHPDFEEMRRRAESLRDILPADQLADVLDWIGRDCDLSADEAALGAQPLLDMILAARGSSSDLPPELQEAQQTMMARLKSDNASLLARLDELHP